MRWLPILLLGSSLLAGPVWKAPKELPYGQLGVLELLEDDPTKPPLPRPGDDKLGPLALRAAVPTADGRGWKLTVQALVPGVVRIPSLDLGDGRRTPELQLTVPRTTPFGAPWVGYGGGKEDILPAIPFPWAWASLLLLPLVLLAGAILRWRRGRAPLRERKRCRRDFGHAWPPSNHQRETLDRGHAAGRALLAAYFGPAAHSWSAQALSDAGLPIWARWVESLDAARFGRTEPPFPSREDLLSALKD